MNLDDSALAYLDETHIATLVTINKDGSPHTAPIWYEYRDEKLYFITGASSVKIRNIERDARVAVSIANDVSPAKYVLVEGTASISTNDIDQVAYDMYRRYQGHRRGTQSAKDMLAEGDMVVVIVEPNKLLSWMGE